MSITREKIEEWAINIIGAVDYDIEKECALNIEEFGEDELVLEVADQLERFLNSIGKNK